MPRFMPGTKINAGSCPVFIFLLVCKTDCRVVCWTMRGIQGGMDLIRVEAVYSSVEMHFRN